MEVVSFRLTPPSFSGLNDLLFGLIRMKMMCCDVHTHQFSTQLRFWSDVFHTIIKTPLREYLLEEWFLRLARSYRTY